MAIAFLVGGSIHLISFGLLPFGIDVYGHTYPPLRHVLMASSIFRSAASA
jgi:hypothetical protein